VTEHRSQCPKEPVECPFKEAGCDVQLLQSELDDHMTQNTQQHLMLMMEAFQKLKVEYKERLERLESQLENGSQRIRAVAVTPDWLLHTPHNSLADELSEAPRCIFEPKPPAVAVKPPHLRYRRMHKY